MEDYDRQYEFQLQLFVRSFCSAVVDDAATHATTQAGHDQQHPPSSHSVHVASSRDHSTHNNKQQLLTPSAAGVEALSSSGRRGGEVSFINAALGGDELSSGLPTPASTVSPTGFHSGVGGATDKGGRRGHPTSATSPSNRPGPQPYTRGGGASAGGPAKHPVDVTIAHLRGIGGEILSMHGTGAAGVYSHHMSTHTSPTDPDNDDGFAQREGDMTGLVDFYTHCGPPKFSDAFSARAYLQQAHMLNEREDQRRQRWLSDVFSQWWTLVHRAAAPLHHLARLEWASRQQVAHRESVMRREVDEEYDLGCAVIRYLSITVLHGAEYSQQLFEACEEISYDERSWRTRLVREELSSRAQITAAMRLLRSHPPDRAWELVEVAQQVLEGHYDHHSTAAGGATSQTTGGTSSIEGALRNADNTVKSRYLVDPPSRGTSVRTFPEVTPAMKAHARKANMMEESGKRSEKIRAFSAALHERLAKTKAEELAAKSISVSATKERNSRHHQELIRARENEVVQMRETCRLEKLVLERQAFESRNPEAAEEYRQFLIDPSSAASRQGWHGEEKAWGVAQTLRRQTWQRTTSNSLLLAGGQPPLSRTNVVRPASAAERHANTLLKSIPFLPKHQLSKLHKDTLEASNRIRRPASGGSRAMRSAFGAAQQQHHPRPYSATLHHISSIDGDRDDLVLDTSGTQGLFRKHSSRPSSAFADFASHAHQPFGGGAAQPQRSSTPPLDPVERALLHECEELFRNMKQRSYHYAPPAPLLYTAEGVDALQTRNLMGDDVEVHLLTPLERIVRWNLRAQLAFRNEQYAAAEVHLKNAMTALHNAEKDRRRAARRRGRRSSTQGGGNTSDGGSGSDAFAHEESTGAFESSASAAAFHNSNTNAASSLHNPHAVPSTAESWTAGYGNLSLQNVKMLTYTTKAFLERALGRYRDALQDLQTVLKVQEQQQEDMAMHARQHQKAAESAASPSTGGGGRRSVMIVSPRDDSERELYEHMAEVHCGVQPDTLVNISALLLQVGNRSESLHFGRRAVEMLTTFAAAENQRMYSSSSTSPSSSQPQQQQQNGGYQQRLADEARRGKGLHIAAPAAASPRLGVRSPSAGVADDGDAETTPPLSARPREGDGVLLRHRQLFIDAVAALHNVAMTQSSEQVAADVEGMAKRRVGKASHAAALRLGRTVLGNDHAVVVRVESSARQVAQLLAQ